MTLMFTGTTRTGTSRAAAGALAIAVLAVSGCSTSGPASDTDDSNATDVAFAQQIVPHQAQALEMAALAAVEGQSPDVRRLAARIAGEQEPAMEVMQEWLDDGDHMMGPGEMGPGEMGPGEMDGSGDGMPGMLGNQRMHALSLRSGAGFDRMFLSMMIDHHRRGIAIAALEADQGGDQDIVGMAAQIEEDDRDQLRAMREMRDQLILR